jgi:RHS repeat-associated protein
MSRISVARFFLLWGLLLAMGSVARAQVRTGTPPFGSFGGGPDVINLANLNAHITVPVLQKSGRGMPFFYNLVYDTSVWQPISSGSTVTWQPAFNFGWVAQTAITTGYVSYTELTQNCDDPPPEHNQYSYFQNWVYHDPYGISHPFSGEMIYDPTDCQIGTQGTLNASSGDGYTLATSLGSHGQILQPTVTFRNGLVRLPPLNLASGLGASGTATDRNGNEITTGGSSGSTTFTDTLGTTALTVAGSATPASPLTLTYTAPSGGSAIFTVKYTAYTVQTNFGCSGITEYSASNVSLLTEIDQPDGTKYTFVYEATPGHSGDVTGRLASMTLPTGGTITYSYSGGSGGITCADGSTATLTRTTPDGTWTYAHSESGTAWTTTVTDPQSNNTTINFQGIYETERQVHQGASTLLKTVFTCYNGNTNTSTCNSTGVGVVTQRSVFTQWPGGQQSRKDTFYNGSQLLTEKDEYAYGNGAPGSIVRKTFTFYASLGNGIASMPAAVAVEDGSGNIKSQTTYTYDQGTVTATSGTPQQIAVSGSRGNATTISSLVSGSTSLSKTYTYYDTGNVNTATDVNGAVTTFKYGSGTSCGNSFATSVSEPLSLSRSMAWNCTGGVETSVTDENGKTTSATYSTDPDFWRPNATADQESNVTNIAYTGATSAESSLNFNGSISTSDALVTLDTLGRVHVAQVKESQSSSTYDSLETDFNSVGLPSRSTLPYTGSAHATNSNAPNLATTYDALGRTLQITDSGGGVATYSYNQNDVLITSGPAPNGEKTKSKQYEYDALGRMTSVCEVTTATGGGSCAQSTAATGFLTQYTYDLNNNLIGVTQNAQSSTTQTRTYAYDALSRLTSEINPESGTTLYAYDSVSTCGTSSSDLGSLVEKTDAVGNVICYLHDGLHRVTSITYPSGSYAANTSNKYFVYDSATVNGTVMANAKTRMAEAYTATSSTGTKITDLGYSYSARGEISAVYESTPHSGGYYSMSATYWPNGALDTIGGLPSLPTLTYTPDGEGRPAIVTASAGQNPVSSTAYNPASLPTSMTLGSSDSDSFTFDPNTDRMTQFQFSVNSQSLTGTIDWNALGTPSSLDITDAFNSADTQNCSFAHDDLTRLATVNCGTIWGQSFTYDAFGNITKTVLSGSSGTSFQPTYASPSTNRIASLPSFTPTYDANGNLTKDPQHQYGWDSDGRPVTIDSLTLTYDAQDRIVEQNNAGAYTQIVYDPLGEKFGLMNGQTLKKAFAPLPDGGIAAYTSSGLAYYRHPDWLGSSRLASTPTRTIYSDTAYAPFGEPYAQSGTADVSFTGQNQDTASNLYDFLFREDSSIQGRWISPDPAGLAAVSLTDPQSWNRYVYVRNSPGLLVDPMGLDDDPNCPGADICVVTNLHLLPDDGDVPDPGPGPSSEEDDPGPDPWGNNPGSPGGGGGLPQRQLNLSKKGQVCQEKVQGAVNAALNSSTTFLGPQMGGHQDDPSDPGLINGAYNFIYFAPGVQFGAGGSHAVPGANCGRFSGSGLHIPVNGGGCNPSGDPNSPFGFNAQQNGSYFTAHIDSANPFDDLVSFLSHLINNVILRRPHGC